MNNLIIQQLRNKDRIPWNLLLLADPSKETVQKYLNKGDLYVALIENRIIGEYILLKISEDIIELKNIAVDEKYQGQGIGKRLILDAINRAKVNKAKKMRWVPEIPACNNLLYIKNADLRLSVLIKDFLPVITRKK